MGCGQSGDPLGPDVPDLDAAAAVDAADAAAPDLSPPPVCDPRKFGAKADGKTKDTQAIQAAIDACAGTGGTVVLANGTFLSGMITLKSDLTFHLEPSATLLGTQDDADYPSTNPPTNNTQLKNCRKSLVYAESANNVRIDGGGTIDGNGNVPKWIGPSSVHPEATRPMAIYTALCSNVAIDGITVRNAAMWGVVNLKADGLTLTNLTIDSTLSGNRDGIDVVDCHHVVISDSTIRSEDDSICIKSGSSVGVDDVTVKNCHVQQSIVANGLKFGTASYGSFTNVTFHGILVENVDKAAIAVESVDGANISNITFSNITVHQAGSPIFILLGDRGTIPTGGVQQGGDHRRRDLSEHHRRQHEVQLELAHLGAARHRRDALPHHAPHVRSRVHHQQGRAHVGAGGSARVRGAVSRPEPVGQHAGVRLLHPARRRRDLHRQRHRRGARRCAQVAGAARRDQP